MSPSANTTDRLLRAIERLRLARNEAGELAGAGETPQTWRNRTRAAKCRAERAESDLFRCAASVERRMTDRRRYRIEIFIDDGLMAWLTALNQVHFVGGLSTMCEFMLRGNFIEHYSTGFWFQELWHHLPPRLKEITRERHELGAQEAREEKGNGALAIAQLLVEARRFVKRSRRAVDE